MGDGDGAVGRPGGELAFIERLKRRLPASPEGQCWIGDDAAVLDAGSLLKTDVLVEGVHFDLAWCSPQDVGWKAVAVNLSDIAAMGGSPSAAVVSLVVRDDEPGVPDRVMDGIAVAADRFGCPIVGGDTSIGPALVVAVAVLGRAHPSGPVLRSGARPGDIVFVTGDLGGAGSALARRLAGEREQPGMERLRRPVPRLAVGAAVAAAGGSAMIDISDGLATDLGHLCSASGCGAVVDQDALPLAPGVDIETALFSGDDYELLFTAPAGSAATFERWRLQPATAIGSMTESGPHITLAGRHGERSLLRRAWEHPIP